MRRNDAKAAVTSAEVQRIPGDKLNIFCRMRERNKLKCGASNIDVRFLPFFIEIPHHIRRESSTWLGVAKPHVALYAGKRPVEQLGHWPSVVLFDPFPIPCIIDRAPLS